MKYTFLNKIYINLQQFQVIPKNKTQGNLINYIPNIDDKKDDKYKESKIVKKCLRWINLQVKITVIMALKGTILLELINNQQGIAYTAGPKREGMAFSGMINLNLNLF